MPTARLQIYSREQCGLCDEMIAGVRELLGPDHSFEVIDIDRDDELRARFGTRIPVLVADDEILCFGHLDRGRLRNWLSHTRSAD